MILRHGEEGQMELKGKVKLLANFAHSYYTHVTYKPLASALKLCG